MVIPEPLFEPVRKIQDTILICAPVISQEAAVGALEAGPAYCRSHLPTIEAARNTVKTSLDQLDDILAVPPADGAFYFLLRLKRRLNDMELTERLIREHRVAVIPGGTFGVHDACRLRVSYGALTPETAQEGARRLAQGLRDLC